MTQTTGPNPALEGPDHPIAWCSNFDGGREWWQVLGHNWELFRTAPWFKESIYQGILTAAGLKPANCVTHGTFSLAAPLQAKATRALGAGFALAAVGGSGRPTSLLTYSGPASNDAVTLSFSPDVGASEALRTGSYRKALTFTLSTTTP